MALILLRHTRPERAEGRCYGRTDLPLAEGFQDDVARLLGELPELERIVSSPLSRCHKLATAIATARNLAVEIDPRFIEMDFGSWEDRPWDDIPRADLDAWLADFDNAKPHGGESVGELAQRVEAAIADAFRGPRPVLAVTHAGVIKAALNARGHPEGWSVETAFGTWREITQI